MAIPDYIYVINISNYPGFGVSVASRKQFTKLGFILGVPPSPKRLRRASRFRAFAAPKRLRPRRRVSGVRPLAPGYRLMAAGWLLLVQLIAGH
jgi:hypothetical protein